MGRASRKRANRRKKAILSLRQSEDETRFKWKINQLLAQWTRQAEFRARTEFLRKNQSYDNGQPIPDVWDLYRRKLTEAKIYGIQDSLAEICRQALARYMESQKVRLVKLFNGPGSKLLSS